MQAPLGRWRPHAAIALHTPHMHVDLSEPFYIDGASICIWWAMAPGSCRRRLCPGGLHWAGVSVFAGGPLDAHASRAQMTTPCDLRHSSLGCDDAQLYLRPWNTWRNCAELVSGYLCTRTHEKTMIWHCSPLPQARETSEPGMDNLFSSLLSKSNRHPCRPVLAGVLASWHCKPSATRALWRRPQQATSSSRSR